MQHLIDCDIYNKGCTRGFMWNSYRFIRMKGYVLEDNYESSYLGVQRPCKTPIASKVNKLSKMIPLIFPPLTVDQMKRLVSHQPVAVALNTPDCFKMYQSGILREEDCECTSDSYFGAEIE